MLIRVGFEAAFEFSEPMAVVLLGYLHPERDTAHPRAHSFTPRSRNALEMTETELKLIAAPAMIGLNSTPKKG
jgi:hypothetical protein